MEIFSLKKNNKFIQKLILFIFFISLLFVGSSVFKSYGISIDEQEQIKLKKYHNFAKQNYHLDQNAASELVNEAFLYLKLKEAPDIDPLTKGDQFGAGFS